MTSPIQLGEKDHGASTDWLTPARVHQKHAAVLAVFANLIWPLQAALVAYAIGALLNGVELRAGTVALTFIALGAMRAMITRKSETQADIGATQVVSLARAQIVGSEAGRAQDSPFGGAGSIAALAGEKLDLLMPFLTRYRPARARVMVVPIVFLILAFSQSWAVGVIFLVSGPLIPVFMALVGMAAKEASRQQMSEISSLNDLLVERLSAIVDIRLLGANDTVIEGFAGQANDLRQRTMAVLRVAFLSSTVLELFAAIGVAMVAVYVGFSLLGALNFGAWGGALSPQAGIFLLLIAPEFYQPLRDLSAAWHDKAAADAVLEELDAWQAAQTPMLMGQGGAATRLTGPVNIAVHNCFLPDGQRLANLDILQGESVALMGPSGAGKTTLLRMIAGLDVVPRGQVRIAGQPLNDATADAWRARIGWMPQTPHFVNASLRHNLTFGQNGAPDFSLEQAAVADVVAKLPQGLNTRLGETGGGLSGGEARRLTLARAIHGAPDVILADEPTADLDAHTAALVSDGLLAQSARGATLIVATHDPDLAAKMDRIIEIGAHR